MRGATAASRARLGIQARIERVGEPRHGSSPKDGTAVVVSFQGPATGEEFTVTNDGERGERISVAWTGWEIGVHYPCGRPHAFRFANHLSDGGRGLGWPNFALFLVYAGLLHHPRRYGGDGLLRVRTPGPRRVTGPGRHGPLRPADPAVFLLDVEAERRSWKRDMAVNVVGVLVVAVADVVGVVAL